MPRNKKSNLGEASNLEGNSDEHGHDRPINLGIGNDLISRIRKNMITVNGKFCLASPGLVNYIRGMIRIALREANLPCYRNHRKITIESGLDVIIHFVLSLKNPRGKRGGYKRSKRISKRLEKPLSARHNASQSSQKKVVSSTNIPVFKKSVSNNVEKMINRFDNKYFDEFLRVRSLAVEKEFSIDTQIVRLESAISMCRCKETRTGTNYSGTWSTPGSICQGCLDRMENICTLRVDKLKLKYNKFFTYEEPNVVSGIIGTPVQVKEQSSGNAKIDSEHTKKVNTIKSSPSLIPGASTWTSGRFKRI